MERTGQARAVGDLQVHRHGRQRGIDGGRGLQRLLTVRRHATQQRDVPIQCVAHPIEGAALEDLVQHLGLGLELLGSQHGDHRAIDLADFGFGSAGRQIARSDGIAQDCLDLGGLDVDALSAPVLLALGAIGREPRVLERQVAVTLQGVVHADQAFALSTTPAVDGLGASGGSNRITRIEVRQGDPFLALGPFAVMDRGGDRAGDRHGLVQNPGTISGWR